MTDSLWRDEPTTTLLNLWEIRHINLGTKIHNRCIAAGQRIVSVTHRDVSRLLPSYDQAERAYRQSAGIYPALHIVAVRRNLALAHPWAVTGLYTALQDSWQAWWAHQWRFPGATPWELVGFEHMQHAFAGDLPPFGDVSASHRRMIETLCAQQHQQGLVTTPVDPTTVFAEFRRLVAECPLPTTSLIRTGEASGDPCGP